MSTPLTELQKQLISKKLDNLRADFPILALRVLCEDGTEWKAGEFPNKQEEKVAKNRGPRTTRERCKEGAVYGHLTDVLKPWIEIAMENPGEVIKLRAEDTDGETLKRCSGGFASIIGGYMGPNHTKTWRSFTESGEEILLVKYVGPRVERYALNYLRKGVVMPHLHAKFLAKNAVTTASHSDAKQEK